MSNPFTPWDARQIMGGAGVTKIENETCAFVY
jgi:hypothetical protein